MGRADPVGPDLALDAVADVVGEHADRADRVAEPDVAELGELLAQRLDAAESAMKARMTSLAPSKIGKMRMSRRIFS